MNPLLEQAIAAIMGNPDAAAMQLAAAGVPAPAGQMGMPPVPTPRPGGAPAAAAVPGVPGAPPAEDPMSGLLKAFAAVQQPEAPRQPSVSVQSVPPTYGNPMTAQFSNLMAQIMAAQGQHQQPGLAGALMGRR